MSKKIKLSIITPTFNRQTALKKNFRSVLNQKITDIEHIIIDNLSSDGTEKLVDEYIKKAPYPVIYIREKDNGIYNAMNKGLKKARGEWTHILNSDDQYYSKNVIKNIFINREVKKYDLIANAIYVDDNNKQIWKPKIDLILNFYNLPHPGIITKNSFYKKWGYYDESYKRISDAVYNINNYKKANILINLKPIVKMSTDGKTFSIDDSYPERLKLILNIHKFPLYFRLFLLAKEIPNIEKFFAYKIKKFDFEKETNYCGFKLTYSKGTSLIPRIRFGRLYEPDLSLALEKELNKIKNPTVLDIGANIGLISLFILKTNPKSRIFAFEPGPHQASLLTKTIETNNLSKKIFLNQIALSNRNGISTFSTHSTKDVSGDGLIDTGRAGPNTIIRVNTKTLDNWWQTNKKPKIDLIKIDTEGAEYLILEKAKKILSQNKPIIFLEIWPTNMRVYKKNPTDLLKLLNNFGYEIYDLNCEKRLTESNINSIVGVNENFIAKYEEKRRT